MATVLTLHQGAAERTFAEHPVEIARRALLDAAAVEDSEEWASIMRRFASALPERKAVA